MRDKAWSEDASTVADTDCEGTIDPDLQAIRSIMRLHKDEQGNGQDAPAESPRQAAPVRSRPVARAHARAAQGSDRPRRARAHMNWLVDRAASFLRRPDAPKILSLVLLLTLAVLRPGFVLFLIVMGFLTALVLYFSIGPDRVQAWVIARYDRLRDRDPTAADRLRRRAAGATRALARGLDKLPDSWTTGLYLPDFEDPEPVPDRLKADPFDRLARQPEC